MAIADQRGRATPALVAIILIAASARTVLIGRLPGINGDEAWYGVNVQEFLAGGTPFWHTGIGNPLNPFHSGPLLLLSTIFGPSAAVLRAPEILMGLLAVALAYPLLRRPLGEQAALTTSLLLAVSPTAISYARLGWDPSGGPLMTLLALAFALRNQPTLALTAVAAAWLVHPTNIFVAPIAAAAWLPHGLDRWRATTATARARLTQLGIAAGVLAVPAAAWVAIRVAANPNTSLPSISMVITRISSPELWADRWWGFVNLLSGVSPVLHIAGPLPGAAGSVTNVAIAGIALLSPIAGWLTLRSHRYARWLLAGLSIAFAGFHVVAMDVALTPTAERYGLFMFVPMVVAVAMSLSAFSNRFPVAGRIATFATVTIMAAMTIVGYFTPLLTRGGDAMTTYRTGATEPKEAAFDFIDTDSRGAGAVRVVADGWWLYWTLRYFAGADGRIQVDVTPGANMPGGTHPAGAAAKPAAPPQRAYLVSFEGGAVPANPRAAALFTARDPVGRPILHVYAEPVP